MSARGQKFTVLWKTSVYYSDFLNGFVTNPTTGALAVVTNEEAIKQAIYNLVMISPGEIPGRASVGSKVLSSLFDLGTPLSIENLKATIQNVIQNFEPRAENVTVVVDAGNIQLGSVNVAVSFQPVNLPQTVEFAFELKRVR